MYKDTITVFNKYSSASGDYWYATVLHNVDLNIDRSAIMRTMGVDSTDNAILHVHYAPGIIVEGKPYKTPKEWDAQTSDEMEQTITFTPGKSFDFFYRGEWDGNMVILDEDYPDGFFEYMKKQYDYVFAITSVSMYVEIPHFEIMAK